MVKLTPVESLSKALEIVQEDKESVLDVHSHAHIRDDGALQLAQHLGKNTNLRVLILGGQGIGPAGAQALGAALRTNMGLQELHLHNNNLGYEGVEKMSIELAKPLYEGSSKPGNKILKTLILRKNGIGAHCGGNCGICRLSPDFPAAFLELTSLSTIDLNGNEITQLPMEFARLPKLLYMDVRNNPITNIPQDVFVTARKGHQSGWPGLKEYMLQQLAQEAGGTATSPMTRVGTPGGGPGGGSPLVVDKRMI
mmetsp:Transcript_4023/g.8142  ORF Transcript_4023/g.8142 Transcript_4023/m.8142 type:complete len:253 (+) Transcript_4023:149-907(+)